jgi:hypothetical protein
MMIYMGVELDSVSEELTIDLLQVATINICRPLFIQQDFSKEMYD